jgi:hypothetical protein
MGACCCDCELFLNAYQPRNRPSSQYWDDEDENEAKAVLEPLPPCAGVRRGSVTPCANWARIYRGR